MYPSILSGGLGVIGYTLFLLVQSPLAAVSLLQMIPPVVVKKYMQVNYDQCRDMEAKITNHVVEAVDGFETMKLYGLKQWWIDKMTAYHKEYLVVGQKSSATLAAQVSMNRLLDNILKFGTYGLMGVYVMAGYCPMEVAVQAIYLSSGLFGAVRTLFSVIPEFAVSKNAETRLDKWDGPKEMPPTSQSGAARQRITADSLAFGYGDKKILENFSYTFNEGQNYLLEGGNGAGKTTLIGLLSGLLLPDSGSIQVNGAADVPDPCRLFLVPQQARPGILL